MAASILDTAVASAVLKNGLLRRDLVTLVLSRPGNLSEQGTKSVLATRIVDSGLTWRDLGYNRAKKIAEKCDGSAQVPADFAELVGFILNANVGDSFYVDTSDDAPGTLANIAQEVQTKALSTVNSFILAFNDTPNALASGMVALASDVYLQQGQEASHPGACAVLEYFINLQKSVKLVWNGGSNFLQILPQSPTWAIVKAWVYFESREPRSFGQSSQQGAVLVFNVAEPQPPAYPTGLWFIHCVDVMKANLPSSGTGLRITAGALALGV